MEGANQTSKQTAQIKIKNSIYEEKKQTAQFAQP